MIETACRLDWGAAGTWFGAVATLGAVLVALWIARRDARRRDEERAAVGRAFLALGYVEAIRVQEQLAAVIRKLSFSVEFTEEHFQPNEILPLPKFAESVRSERLEELAVMVQYLPAPLSSKVGRSIGLLPLLATKLRRAHSTAVAGNVRVAVQHMRSALALAHHGEAGISAMIEEANRLDGPGVYEPPK